MTTTNENITGQTYWRSIAERAQSPELREAMENEFVGYDPDALLNLPRRQFVLLAGASMALAGLTLTGCRRWPEEQVAPFTARPDDFAPGMPIHYASSIERAGIGQAVMVVTYDGRPIKIETHQAVDRAGQKRFGVPSMFDQAEVLSMYDPDRLRSPQKDGAAISWDSASESLQQAIVACPQGEGLLVLAEAFSGPSAQRLKQAIKARLPKAKWISWEATRSGNQARGLQQFFETDTPLRPQLDLAKAKIIVSLDCDLLGAHPNGSQYARGWAEGRSRVDTLKQQKQKETASLSRLYAIESAFSQTGTVSDERLAVKPSQVTQILQAIAARVGVAVSDVKLSEEAEYFVNQKLIPDLKAAKGRVVLELGDGYAAEAHALVAAIMERLNSECVSYVEEFSPVDGVAGLSEAVAALDAAAINSVVVLGGNPVFTAPGDLDLIGALGKAKHCVHLTDAINETSKACALVIPRTHPFECFGDSRAFDGTLLLQQPQIVPLFDARSELEVMALLAGEISSLVQLRSQQIVRQTMQQGALSVIAELGFEKTWRRVLQAGFAGDAAEDISVAGGNVATLQANSSSAEFEVVFRPTGPLFDGRFANNGWLQELPEVTTKVTWDNPVLISMKDAEALNIGNEDYVVVTVDGREVKLPVFVSPGQAPGTLVMTSGHGREQSGRVGGNASAPVGFNTYRLRGSQAWGSASANVRVAGGSSRLATTTVHHLIGKGERDITVPLLGETPKDYMIGHRIGGPAGSNAHQPHLLREWTAEEYLDDHFVADPVHGNVRLQLFTPPSAFNDPHAWAMTVDLNACTGCGACVVACQAENNIPNVGKDQVWRSREMHWLRIDTYYKGDPTATEGTELEATHMPLACVHCEKAPCEQVCPVAATVHDSEGLNTMVYNRCIGTRYCSNNCPYKVRRYNYFDFHAKPLSQDVPLPWVNVPDTQQQDGVDAIRKLAYNPEVTVRMRGVMEKCTYCTQRIARARIAAREDCAAGQRGEKTMARSEPLIREGEVVTACQSACATGAIVFGNLNDKSSKVYQLQSKNKRSFGLLSELDSRPRTKHLARIRNPHPVTLEKRKAAAVHHDGDHDDSNTVSAH